MPTSLSPYPNLEQLKKQAKDLRKAQAAGSLEAAKRLKVHVHRFADLSDEDALQADLALRDAQHVIACEHGFAGWRDMLEVVSPKASPPSPGFVVDSVAYSEDELLPAQILRVEIVERPDDAKAAVVLLRADDRGIIIAMGELEGVALSRCIKGQDSARPLTHDLLSTCLGVLHGVAIAVVIYGLQETTFLAHVVLEVDGERRYVDARPSDSLNLAARQPAPIYVTPSVIEQASVPLSGIAKTQEVLRRDAFL